MTIAADMVQQIIGEMRLPALSIYGGDWLRDPVSSCSLSAQALWFRLMLVMHDAKPYGHLVGANGEPLGEKQLVRQIGCSAAELRKLRIELETVGVPGRTGDKDYEPIFRGEVNNEEIDLSPLRITTSGVIYSRRMVRDQRLRVVRRLVTILGKPKSAHLTGQTSDQNAERDARGRADNENEYVLTLDSPNIENQDSRAEKLSPQKQAVKEVGDALEEHTTAFAVPDGGRIAKAIKSFGLAHILTAITDEGDRGTLDGRNWSYLHQILESRKRRPHGITTGRPERRRETVSGEQQAARDAEGAPYRARLRPKEFGAVRAENDVSALHKPAAGGPDGAVS